jgi:hypothetical protein
MDVMHERVAGLDVHKETIVACVRIMAGGKATRECRTFDTTTAAQRDQSFVVLRFCEKSPAQQAPRVDPCQSVQGLNRLLSDDFALVTVNAEARHMSGIFVCSPYVYPRPAICVTIGRVNGTCTATSPPNR